MNVKSFVLGAILLVPVTLSAQNRDRQDRHPNDQQVRTYQDRIHNDTHQWNGDEDQRYRQYLQEHHKKYRNFETSKKREQNDYWNWRHSHQDNDHR